MAFGLRKGDVFARRYRVERLLAAGGMGAIYEVVHLDTQRRRALKVMLPHVLGSDEMRERFKREALVAAGVESEFIVDVYDAGVDDETQMPFLVMELLRGEELGKHLKRVGKLAPADAVSYLHQTARALDKLHRASLVHRDLKPENIFLAEREDGPPRVKLLDFGVAKLVAEGASAAGVTEVVGTPSYMAPEQFRTAGGISPAADVYAFGLTAYTLLVGTPYWQDETTSGNVFAIALVAARGTEEPATLRAARRGVALPAGFDAWFATVTAMDPGQRYVSATTAVRALAQVMGLGQPLSVAEGVGVAAALGNGIESNPPVSAPAPRQEGADPPVPGPGLPSYSATVQGPPMALATGAFAPRRRWRPALLAVAMMGIGGALALALGTLSSTPPPPTGGAATPASAAPTSAPGPSTPSAPVPAATDAGSPPPSPQAEGSALAASTPPPARIKGPPTKGGPRPRPTAVYSQE